MHLSRPVIRHPMGAAELRYRLRSRLSDGPLYRGAIRTLPSRRNRFVRSDSLLAIEAFPRSANTFMHSLVFLATDRHVASHTHSVANCVVAQEMGKPGVVIVREPLAAVASLKVRLPRVSAGAMLREYCRFYRSVGRYPGLIVYSFESVTSAPIATLRDLSFATSIHLPLLGDDGGDVLLERSTGFVEEKGWRGEGPHPENLVARPSEVRRLCNLEIRNAIRRKYPQELSRAASVYRSMSARFREVSSR